MSPRRRKQQDLGVIILVIILAIVAFILLPKWAQILIVVIGAIAFIEIGWQYLFKFSLIKWIWQHIV